MKVDVLAIGSHPDDIELTCGGTVASLVKQGKKVALADLTQGELGTRGSKEIRIQEAEAAAKILGAVTRRNLHIPDGNIEMNETNLHKVISLIRELQPKVLLIPHSVERHPDHVHTHQLCKEAWFYSGLHKIKTSKDGSHQAPHRAESYFEYMQWYEFPPSFIVDVSHTFEVKMESIRAHTSQFHNPNSTEPETILTQPDFLKRIENGALHYGKLIGVKYGEPFYSWVPFGVRNLFDLVLAKG